ncbi:MAG: hypothetical protein HYV36_08980, partial [Lentisphaerae bacterium]|nr:hypothetical protein [Lentisphaerota bacterium]
MTDDFNRALQLLAGPRGHVHFIGICGVGMAALAFQLKQKGFRVSGCDLRADELATWLEGLGIEVRRGHDPAHLAEAQWVVRTAAVRPDHPEIISAVARGISVLPRGLVLAALLREFFSVIVCGSHGKTTTTAMLTQIFTSAGREPSFCIGGVVPAATEPVALQRPPECILEGGRLDRRGSVAGAGAGNFLLAEADESDGTLSFYEPDIAIVTNIEFDHAEHFTCLAELRACFQKMLKKVRRNIVYCRDDPEAAALCRDLAKGVSYGLASGGHSFSSRARPPATLGVALRAGEGVDSSCADWRATAIKEQAESISFQVWRGAEKMGIVNLPAPGRHNALNALAACAAAQACGIEFAASQAGLQTFQPVRRRFERLIATPDVQVITDYAHHPSEITATLANLPRLKRKRFFAVFQPHRYSRTRALVREFAAALSARGRSARGGKNVDELILTPVYAASELPLTGGTHWDLYEQVRQAGHLRV